MSEKNKSIINLVSQYHWFNNGEYYILIENKTMKIDKYSIKKVSCLFALGLCLTHSAYCQSKWWTIKIGNTITRYEFISSNGVKIDYLKPGSGNAFTIGYASSFLDTNQISNKSSSKSVYFLNHPKLSKILSSMGFGLNAVLNQFNAVGGVQNMDFDYQTNFIGLESHLGPDLNLGKDWKLRAQVQGSLQYLIQGNQHINFNYIDLRKDSDFNSAKLLFGYSGTIEKKVYSSIAIFITYANNETMFQSKSGVSTFNFNSTFLGVGLKFFRLD